MSSDLLIQVKDVSKCYPVFSKPQDRLKQTIIPRLKKLFSAKPAHKYYKEFWALRNISFDVCKGEMVGVIGCNGSGKSTLLQLVCGTMQPTHGVVNLKAARVAALLELGAGFNPEFTGRENIYMNGTILGLSGTEIDDRFDEIVAFSEIGEFIEQPVKNYSSGMFMRLAFSIAVSVEPDVVIVDEALAVGDIGFSMKCMQRIEEMIASGVTFLLVTHDLGLVRSLCTRAIYLRDHQCAFDGDPETATEMFLMDTRGAQAASLDQKMVFREPLNKDGMAFGTGLGKILDVQLFANNEERSWFRHGERIDVEVTAWLSEELRHPAVSMVVRNHKAIVICGLDSRRSDLSINRDDNGVVRFRFSFDARMLPGAYNMAGRILDFPYGSTDLLIEKQLNIGSFEIIDDSSVPKGIYGLVEMNGRCEQLYGDFSSEYEVSANK